MAGETATLLVVDDAEMNRDMLSRRLAKKGFNVLVAENGQAALDILARDAVDLVLLDIMMPGIDGLEVLRRLRTTRGPSQLPVIMVTAKDAGEDVVAALKAGANDYVAKPIDFNVVLARTQTQLALKRAQDELTRKVEEIQRLAVDLHRASITDFLTKQFNRRHFLEVFQTEIERAVRYGTHLSLVILDIDHFKAVNDGRGHLVGDNVLAGVAATVRASVRSHDVVARYGGEEFVVVLPQTDESSAVVVAEKLRRCVAETLFEGMDGAKVTVSLGLVSLGCQQADVSVTVDKLIGLADAALYRANEGGRNRVEVSKVGP